MGWSAIVPGFYLIQTYGFWFAGQPLVIDELERAFLGLSVVPFLISFGIIIILLPTVGLMVRRNNFEQTLK